MKSLKYLNKYLWKYKYRLVLGILFVTAANVFGIYPPQIVREAFNRVSDSSNKSIQNTQNEHNESFLNVDFLFEHTEGMELSSLLLYSSVLIIIMSLITGIFTFFTRQTIIIMSRKIEYDLKNEIYEHYQNLSMSFYKKNNTGDIMNRISEDVSRVRMYLGPGIMYSINLITLFVLSVTVMLSINVELTIYALAPLPILSILIYYVSNKINKKSEGVQEQLSFLSTFSQESFSGIRIIKSYIKEKFMLNTLEKEAELYRSKNLNLVRLEAFFFPIMMLLIGLSTILTIYIGSLKSINDPNFSNGNIIEFIIFVNKLTWPVTALGWVTSLVQRAAASQKRINAFLETEPEIKNPGTEKQQIKGAIEFNSVGFTYPDSGTVALKDISFKVEPGETLAIIGKTGSGKSTIADLICRLYDSNQGSIYIDGTDIKAINLNALRSNIGYVPQEVFLFSDSISNNIAFGLQEEKIAEEAIEKAAKQAVIYSNIVNFPQKFNTELGERGITLSGGQKQRISIARAIIKSPTILLFDDCLSAVDTETEEAILNNLKDIMANKTAIIISHRISSVQHADQILVLDEGQVIERGKHDDLLAKQGIYYDTYQKQLLEEEQQTA